MPRFLLGSGRPLCQDGSLNPALFGAMLCKSFSSPASRRGAAPSSATFPLPLPHLALFCGSGPGLSAASWRRLRLRRVLHVLVLGLISSMRGFGLCSLICSGGSPIPTSGPPMPGCGATLSRVTPDQTALLCRRAGLGPRVLQDCLSLSFLLRPFPKEVLGIQLHARPPLRLQTILGRTGANQTLWSGLSWPLLATIQSHAALTPWVGLCRRFLWLPSCPSFDRTGPLTPADFDSLAVVLGLPKNGLRVFFGFPLLSLPAFSTVASSLAQTCPTSEPRAEMRTLLWLSFGPPRAFWGSCLGPPILGGGPGSSIPRRMKLEIGKLEIEGLPTASSDTSKGPH